MKKVVFTGNLFLLVHRTIFYRRMRFDEVYEVNHLIQDFDI